MIIMQPDRHKIRKIKLDFEKLLTKHFRDYFDKLERTRLNELSTKTAIIRTYGIEYKCRNCNHFFTKAFIEGNKAPEIVECLRCKIEDAVKSWTDPNPQPPHIPAWPTPMPIYPYIPTPTTVPYWGTTCNNRTTSNEEAEKRESNYLAKRKAFYNES